jgi:hypothetical protein
LERNRNEDSMNKERIKEYFGKGYVEFYQRYLPDLTADGMALCPFHDDRNPSFSLYNIIEGKWKCHGACCGKGGDIFAFYALQHGLNVKSDFPKVVDGIAEDFGIGGNGRGHRVFPAKRVKQPVSKEHKDHGKWPEHFNDILISKNIIILPDHDLGGVQHAENIARMLYGKAKSIKIIELPNPQRKLKYDVSDFIAITGSPRKAAHQLLEMVKTAPVYDGGEVDWSGLLEGLTEPKTEPARDASGNLLNTPEAVTAEYVYHDADGKEVLMIKKKEWHEQGIRRKTFRPWKPGKRVKWVECERGERKDLPRYLYRLPEVVAADTVWIVEGEKDADALRALSVGTIKFVTTTNDGGAAAGKVEPPTAIDVGEPEAVFTTQEAEIIKQEPLQFPMEVMKGAAGRFTEVMFRILESPPQFFYFSYLTALGTLLSPHLATNSVLTEQARLYTVLMGQSGTTRKSTAISQTVKLFVETLGTNRKPKDPNIPGFNVVRGVGSAEGLQKKLKPAYFDFETEEEDDAVADDLEEQACGCLLALDEFKGFISKCTIQGSVLLETVNTLFQENVSENSTKKQDFLVENAYLGVLAACTTETYEHIFTTAFLNIGFPNRLWIVPGIGVRKHAWPPPLPDETKQELKRDLLEVLKHVGVNFGRTTKGAYTITKEANARYEQWYHHELESSIHATRLETNSKRLMLLLTANNLKDQVDLDTVEDAIVMCNWQLKARRMYDPIDSESKMAEMEERIRRKLIPGPLKWGKLAAAVHYKRAGTWLFTKALEGLIKFEEVEEIANKIYRLKKPPMDRV